jgi:K+-sensing histidine kinase KdpD
MRGAVEQMQIGCGMINSTCERMFTVLEQQIFRLDRLVQDVLNAAQIESGEIGINVEPISIFHTIHQVVEQFQTRTSDREVTVQEKPGMPLVLADSLRISEVLVNLLDNADKYTAQNKEISIDVRADQTEVSVAVRDFGSGIPLRDINHLFEKFYRTDSSDSQSAYGYGLGLYVCRYLVEAQGGRIWVENHIDGGAVFTFTLPVWEGKTV